MPIRAVCLNYSSMRPQTVEKIISVVIAAAEVIFDLAFHLQNVALARERVSIFHGFKYCTAISTQPVLWVHFWLSWGSFGVIFGRLGGCLEFLGES